IALHYRLNPEAEAEAHALAQTLSRELELEFQPGKMMVELRVAGGDRPCGTAPHGPDADARNAAHFRRRRCHRRAGIPDGARARRPWHPGRSPEGDRGGLSAGQSRRPSRLAGPGRAMTATLDLWPIG